MYKRSIAGILGSIAVIASFWPAVAAFEIFKDFRNPDVPFWSNLVGVLIMGSIGLGAVLMGIRFLRFALNGPVAEGSGRLKAVLLGIGFFFPGFVFSFPLTILFVTHTWPGDDGTLALAFEASVCLGVLAAVICALLLLRKRKAKPAS